MNQNCLIIKNAEINLIQDDIIKQKTDAIVNAANSTLMGGGGVDGAIHRAGGSEILSQCKKIIARIGTLEPGRAVITTGGRLNARYVIHTVGPVWRGGENMESTILANAYVSSLRLAIAHRLRSISFPSISTGAYHYPLSEAAKVALTTVINFVKDNKTPLEKIYFVLFNENSLITYMKVLGELSL